MHETSGLVFAELFTNFLRSKLNHGCLFARVMISFKIIFCCYVKNDLKIVISSFESVISWLVFAKLFMNFLRSKLNHG